MSAQIYGLGVDIVSVQEVRESLATFGETYALSVCSREELRSAPPQFGARARWLAARFAAKEAAWKAGGIAGDPPLRWSWIRVDERDGLTHVHLPAPLARSQTHASTCVLVSLSSNQDRAYALAVGAHPHHARDHHVHVTHDTTTTGESRQEGIPWGPQK